MRKWRGWFTENLLELKSCGFLAWVRQQNWRDWGKKGKKQRQMSKERKKPQWDWERHRQILAWIVN